MISALNINFHPQHYQKDKDKWESSEKIQENNQRLEGHIYSEIHTFNLSKP